MSAKSSRVWKVILIVFVLQVGGVFWVRSWVQAERNRGCGRSDGAKTQIRIMETAVFAYQMKNGKNPECFDDIREFLKGGEIPETPWHGKYFYSPTSTNEGFTYEIWCVAPDGTRIGNTTLSRRPVSSR